MSRVQWQLHALAAGRRGANVGRFCAVQPTWPFGKGRAGRPPPPFFPVEARPGLLVAILMGLQHALAMVGGIITPPLLVYRVTVPDVRPPPPLAYTPLGCLLC